MTPTFIKGYSNRKVSQGILAGAANANSGGDKPRRHPVNPGPDRQLANMCICDRENALRQDRGGTYCGAAGLHDVEVSNGGKV